MVGRRGGGNPDRLVFQGILRGAGSSPLLGLAGLCLGHTARRFGRLGDESLALVRALAARAEADPADVDGRALDGYDDVRSFLFPR
ncbi:hypothetical protein [Streptomyces sp. Adlamb9]|uniref:hypothetical protein n=1 Tax=Streptomyces sp. Adlamb9 TaxID=3400629 RepID=UPI003F1CF474